MTHASDNDTMGSSAPWHDRPQHDGWLRDGGDVTRAAQWWQHDSCSTMAVM